MEFLLASWSSLSVLPAAAAAAAAASSDSGEGSCAKRTKNHVKIHEQSIWVSPTTLNRDQLPQRSCFLALSDAAPRTEPSTSGTPSLATSPAITAAGAGARAGGSPPCSVLPSERSATAAGSSCSMGIDRVLGVGEEDEEARLGEEEGRRLFERVEMVGPGRPARAVMTRRDEFVTRLQQLRRSGPTGSGGPGSRHRTEGPALRCCFEIRVGFSSSACLAPLPPVTIYLAHMTAACLRWVPHSSSDGVATERSRGVTAVPSEHSNLGRRERPGACSHSGKGTDTPGPPYGGSPGPLVGWLVGRWCGRGVVC